MSAKRLQSSLFDARSAINKKILSVLMAQHVQLVSNLTISEEAQNFDEIIQILFAFRGIRY